MTDPCAKEVVELLRALAFAVAFAILGWLLAAFFQTRWKMERRK